MSTKNLLLSICTILIIIAGIIYFFTNSDTLTRNSVPETATSTAIIPTASSTTATSTEAEETITRGASSTIGTSEGGTTILAYHFGTGPKEVLFITGIHGGYSWSTVTLGYEIIDFLTKNPSAVPSNVTVTVIPVLNPDGLKAVVGSTDRFTAANVPSEEAKRIVGRFNENNVDINRNFDCQWKQKGTWQNREVSGGDEAFSEPESQAIRKYVERYPVSAVVAWYSAAGGVYASNCGDGVLASTTALVSTFAQASGYKAYNEFNYYEINGDMMNWFAKLQVPAISVLLTAHNNTEWTKNKAGIDAVLTSLSQ